jgi:hypothetical protein
VYSDELIKNDTTNNTNGFSKGYGGLFLHPCTGADPACLSWWDVGAGQGGHAYRSIADGNTVIDHWAKWQTQELPANSAPYEVFVWIPTVPGLDSDTFTWQAKYYVVDGQGTTFTTIVDEYIGDGENYNPRDQWLSIGVYYMTSSSYIYTTDATGEANNTHCLYGPNHWCRMAVDAIKLVRLGTTYIPNIDPLSSGWSTPIMMSNNGGGTSREKWSFFNAGSYACGQWWPTIPPLGQTTKYPGCDPVDSAIVDSDQDVVMVNVQRYTSPVYAHAYNGIGISGSDNPFRASTIHYLPFLYSKDAWHFYSTITVFNPNESNAYIYIYIRKQDNSGGGVVEKILSPHESYRLDIHQVFGWTDFFGKATLYSTPSVAVVVEHLNPINNIIMDYNAFPAGSNYVFLPYLMKSYNGWNSCFVVQNTAANSTTVNINYYRDNGSVESRSFSLAGNNAKTECQINVPNIDGASSAYIWTSNPATPIVVAANQDNGAGGQEMGYSGPGTGTTKIIIPYLVSNYLDDDGTWNSGIRILNVGSSTTTIYAYFYDVDGNLVTSRNWTVNAKYGKGIYLPSLDLWDYQGSAILIASQPILALGNASCYSGCTGDTSFTYNEINR